MSAAARLSQRAATIGSMVSDAMLVGAAGRQLCAALLG
jgi:hypothetical protein